jgi:hypothetical protein
VTLDTLPLQWWRSRAKCPACGHEELTVPIKKPPPGTHLELWCTRCEADFHMLCYALTPWWRRWGLGSRWVGAKLEPELLTPSGGAYR